MMQDGFIMVEQRRRYNKITKLPSSVVLRVARVAGIKACAIDEVALRGVGLALASLWANVGHALGLLRDKLAPP